MKAKFINETFEKGKKPVGMDSLAGIDHWIDSWQNKGMKFGWMFFQGDEIEKKKDFVSKYHQYIDKYLNQLNEAGVPWKDMTFWGDHVDIKSYRIGKGNWSLFQCITREDAENLIKILKNITTGNQEFHVEEDKESINLSDKIHRESDPEHRKWEDEYAQKKGYKKRRNDLDFLDGIKETRKKLKSIK